MKLKSMISSSFVCLLTLQWVCCKVYDFSSPIAKYQILQFNGSYSYLASRCEAIDAKWTVARIADSRIKRFLENVFNTINSQETFYIGGNTNVSEGNTLDDDNFGSDSGEYHLSVVLSQSNLRLRSTDPSDLLPGILCGKATGETSGLTFSSTTHDYQKLVNDIGHSFEDWYSRCKTELGGEWNPAILESTQEMDFIKAAQAWFSDIKSFWIDEYTRTAPWSLIDLCEVNIRAEEVSYCLNNPCVNGECWENDRGYICTCQACWTGVNCDTAMKVMSSPDLWCTTPTGWYGPDPYIYYSFESDSSITFFNGAGLTPDGKMGFGLNGTLPTSYVEYNSSLVDDCLQVPLRGCRRTVAFWVQFPDRNAWILSTARAFDDRNIADNTMNSGFLIHTHNGKLFVDMYRDTQKQEIEPLGFRVTPGVWHHIAFAYRDIRYFRLYINSVWKTIGITPHSIPQTEVDTFMGSGNLEGQSNGIPFEMSGFGIIDELLVFPDFLSEYQIEQLNHDSY